MPSDEMRAAERDRLARDLLDMVNNCERDRSVGTLQLHEWEADLLCRAAALLSERGAREPDAWIAVSEAETMRQDFTREAFRANVRDSEVVPVYFGSPPSRQPEPEEAFVKAWSERVRKGMAGPESLDVNAFRELLSAATSLADEHGVEIGDPDTYPVHHWYEWEWNEVGGPAVVLDNDHLNGPDVMMWIGTEEDGSQMRLGNRECEGVFEADILLPTRHAIAALALHGQPFGPSWEMVAWINRRLMELEADYDDPDSEWHDDGGLYDEIQEGEAVKAFIAALLPPREP